MRVVIPFGPRRITGFVVSKTSESEFEQLKEIIDVLDLTPVLTPELLELGKWLAHDTLCLYIVAFQAMLPQVLKAKYDKEIIRMERSELSNDLEQLFAGKKAVAYESLANSNISYSDLQQAIQAGDVVINYIVKSQVTKKYLTMVKPAKSYDLLVESLQKLPGNAKIQQQLISFFLENYAPIEQSKLLSLLKVNRGNIKALIDKQLLAEEKVEIYRNPYDDDSIVRTTDLVLTEEQQAAITPIKEKIADEEHEVFLLHGVTGSGKTEVYLQAIQDVIGKGQEAIVLVPEISLTPQMVNRFKGRFGSKVAVLHSALSADRKSV